MRHWRERIEDRLAWWPLRDRLLTLAGVLMVGLIAYSLIARDDGLSSRSAAELTTTTHPAGLDATSSTVRAVAVDVAVTTPPSSEPPVPDPEPAVTEPPTTAAARAQPSVTVAVTLPPTTVRTTVPVTATPTTSRVGPFCGFAPGAIVDIDLNGRPSGRQTADGNGCVTVNR